MNHERTPHAWPTPWRVWALLAALAVCIVGALGIRGTAKADPGTLLVAPVPLMQYPSQGTMFQLGMVARTYDGHSAYCIEDGVPNVYEYDDKTHVTSTAEAKRLAWLADRYKDSADQLTHAAIGWLAHEHFEDPSTQGSWNINRQTSFDTIAGLRERVDALWRESETAVGEVAAATYAYAKGRRTGHVDVEVRSPSGAHVSGVPYEVVIDGPAVFDSNGSATVSGVTMGAPMRLAWTATGDGKVTVTPRYGHPTLDRIHHAAKQDFVVFGGQGQSSGKAIVFDVVRSFRPTLATQVSDKVLAAGDIVEDEVVSGVQEGDEWADGVTLKAEGYYFTGIGADRLGDVVRPNTGEGAQAFLDRLAGMGRRPVAYAAAEFDAPGQRVRARAVDKPGGNALYRARGGDGIGTWVWAFRKDAQEGAARDYVRADHVSPFLLAEESASTRSPVEVDSTATEHSVQVGAQITDTITVSGFPADHGEFEGDEAYGIGPDVKLAQVSVHWSADVPSAQSPPSEDDETHRLVGTWDYPAVNGVIKVGGGRPDAHGEPVEIIAEKPGYYVFVYAFAGDDRAAAVTSAWNDPWERVHATPEPVPALTTAVRPDVAKVGEPIVDTAHVTGMLKDGYHVTFSAWEPVERGVEPGSSAKLLDEVRVELDPDKVNQTVFSPEVKADRPGVVYWSATLWDELGNVVDTHPLGIDGEKTEIEEPEEEEELPETGAHVTSALALAIFLAMAGATMVIRVRWTG